MKRKKREKKGKKKSLERKGVFLESWKLQSSAANSETDEKLQKEKEENVFFLQIKIVENK